MKLLTLQQAAEVLAISPRHLIQLTNHGELPFINLGRGMRKIRRYDPADIQAFIESRKATEVSQEVRMPVRALKRQKQDRIEIVDFRALLEERRANRRKQKS